VLFESNHSQARRRIRVVDFFGGIRPITLIKNIGILMEKFIIKVTDSGVVVIGEKGDHLEFSAGEALMLLDILKNEEVELRKMADAASPLSVKFHF
jgi:hypothetical protein